MAEKKKAAGDQVKGVSVRVSPETRRRAKVYAAQNNRSLMDVVDAAVAEYLARPKRNG